MNSFASPQTLTALPFSLPQDDLYTRLFDAILEQRIHAQSRFTEESLAQMFGARRSDIRGVLTRLSHQQIIVLKPNHRPRVVSLDHEQTKQTLHARRLTEITLVQLACERRCRQDWNRLHSLIEKERLCTEPAPAIRLSGDFHLLLAEMAGNAPLAHFLDSLVPLTSLAIAQCAIREEKYCDWQMHEEILDAIERGDALDAQMLLNGHLDTLEELLLNSTSLNGQNRIAG